MKNIHQITDEFDQEMIGLYHKVRRRCRYQPSRFLRMVVEHGGLQTAKMLLARPEITSGFGELWMRGAPDLTVEALVLQPRFRQLFTEEELECAKCRLWSSAAKAA